MRTALFALILLLTSQLSFGASALLFEVDAQGEAQKKKKYIASSTDASVLKVLRTEAILDARHSAIRTCGSLGGTASEFACLRSTHNEVVHKFGGRVGYDAFHATATVSILCAVKPDQLSWMTEKFYRMVYPVLKPCPPNRML
jgi:hypothetical protein